VQIQSKPKKLYRSRDRVIGGGLAGFAEYIHADKMLIRLMYILLSLFSAGFPGKTVSVTFSAVVHKKTLNLE